MKIFGYFLNDKEIGMLIGAIGICFWILKGIFKILKLAFIGWLGIKVIDKLKN